MEIINGNGLGAGSVFLVKVYSYEDKGINGILYDVSNNARWAYSNMTQLILKIEEILNANEKRDTSKKEVFDAARREGHYEMVEGSKPWIFDKQRVFATFRLQICFRKFGTWQGTMLSSESGKSSAFRSILEMTLMMDSELESVGAAMEESHAGE